MKRIASILTVLFAIGIAGSTPVLATTNPTIIPWVGSVANHAGYWEDYILLHYQLDVTCTKVDRGGEFTTGKAHDFIIIKNDQHNFIWHPAPAGTYTTDKGVSHWFKCDGPDTPTTTPKVGKPKARILGPCGDPQYGFILNNKKRDVQTTFNVIYVGKDGWTVKTFYVRANHKRILPARWVKGGTNIKVKAYDGRRFNLLAKERAAPGGFYGWNSNECRLLS